MIKILGWDHYDGPLLDVFKYFLAESRPSSPAVFPNLYKVFWSENRKDRYQLLSDITSSSNTLQIDAEYVVQCESINDGERHFEDVAQILRFLAKHEVSGLTISLIGIMQQDQPAVDYRIVSTRFYHELQTFLGPQYSGLKRLNVLVGAPLPQVIRTASGLSHLTELSFQLHDAQPLESLSFPELKFLEVSFVTPNRSCVQFMQQLDCPRLDHLTLSFGISGTWGEIAGKLFHSFCDYANTPCYIYAEGVRLSNYFNTVTSFTLLYWSPSPPPGNDSDVFETLLRRSRYSQQVLINSIFAYPFPNVTNLTIETTAYKEIPWNFICYLTSAFPGLQEFSMVRPRGCGFGDAKPLYLPLQCVHEFVSVLPFLHTLRIAFIPSEVLMPHGQAGYINMLPCTTLKRWDLLDSSLRGDGEYWENDIEHKLREVARYIKMAFPELEGICCWEEELYAERWRSVKYYLFESDESDILYNFRRILRNRFPLYYLMFRGFEYVYYLLLVFLFYVLESITIW